MGLEIQVQISRPSAFRVWGVVGVYGLGGLRVQGSRIQEL